jgi:hypothetical protein
MKKGRENIGELFKKKMHIHQSIEERCLGLEYCTNKKKEALEQATCASTKNFQKLYM